MYSKGNGLCGDDDDDGCESVSHDAFIFSSQGSAAAPWFIIFEYKNVHVLTERHVNGVY